MLGLGTGINKLSAAEAASIAARNAGSYLLDDYSGAAAAYSLRQLSSTYSGSSVKVRRASDNVEADIGFASGELDTTALASHCGASDGFVSVWYDQANSNNATQATAANQPKIYDGTTGVVTLAGKPCFSLVGKSLETTLSTIVTDANAFYCAGSISGGKYVLQPTSSGTTYFAAVEDGSTASPQAQFSVSSYHVNGTQITSPNRDKLYDAIVDQGIVSVDYSCSQSRTYEFGYGLGFDNVNMQEVIIYHSDQSSNRTNIEDNINTFYSIY